jgi:hypothetical protein
MPWDRRQKSQAGTDEVNEHSNAVAITEIEIHRFMGIEPFAPMFG